MLSVSALAVLFDLPSYSLTNHQACSLLLSPLHPQLLPCFSSNDQKLFSLQLNDLFSFFHNSRHSTHQHIQGDATQ